jgi:hypothetical protein
MVALTVVTTATMAIVITVRIIDVTATLRGIMAAAMVGHITAGDMVMAGRA